MAESLVGVAPTGWRLTTLGEVATFQRGFDLPVQERRPGPFPVVASTGVVGSHTQAKAAAPGVVIGRSGSLGGAQLLCSDYWPLNTTLWVKDFHGNDERFVYYLLKSLDLSRFNVGSGVPTLNRNHIHPLPVRIPDLPRQRRIAEILGALDDKIELNHRVNRTLESIARAIFRSWFVDFDPVRAKEDGRWREGQSLPGLPVHLYDLFPRRLADSGAGQTPEGWEVGTLGDLSHKPQYGYTASAKSEPVGPKFLRITDINKAAWIEWGSVPYCEMEDGDREKYRLHQGDVLIARMADPGHGVMIEDDQDAVFASYLIRFRPKNVDFSRFLQYWLRSRSYWEMVKGRGSGTTRVSLNAQVLGSFPLVIPPRSVASAFAELVGRLRLRVVANASETQLLAAARDALLPKLISGELQVRAAKRTVGGEGG